MPTYEYRCRGCGHEFEQFQSIMASPVRTCPRCGKRKVERKLSTGGGILFKGGGFFETDYRSDSYRKAADADSKAAEPVKPETKAEGKVDAKADAKSDAKAVAEPAKPAAKQPAPAKGHAREGRGIGNILQAGRATPKKQPSRRRGSR